MNATDERFLQIDSWIGALPSLIGWAQLLMPDQASLPIAIWALLLPVESLPGLSLLVSSVGATAWSRKLDVAAQVLTA